MSNLEKIIENIILNKSENFVDLVKLSGLNPKKDFRFANLEGIDFSNCDLRGFDFTGSDFSKSIIRNTKFEGSNTNNAIFPHDIVSPQAEAIRIRQLKKDSIVAAISRRLNKNFSPKSSTFFESNDKKTRIVCTISKKNSTRNAYWYAFHPKWQIFLRERLSGYFILGCTDLDVAFSIPIDDIELFLPRLGTSHIQGRKYWHIHVKENDEGEYELIVPRTHNILLDKYKVSLDKI